MQDLTRRILRAILRTVMDDTPNTIGARLKQAREDRLPLFTREHVRDRLKEIYGETVSISKLEKWENGRNKPEATWTARLADLYEENWRWIFGLSARRDAGAVPAPAKSAPTPEEEPRTADHRRRPHGHRRNT